VTWTDDWLGLPYEPLGRGPKYDCLGLFLAVQAARFGRRMPYGLVHMGAAEETARARYIVDWQPVEKWERGARRMAKAGAVREGDAVLMRRGRGWHLGIALDETRMLHGDEPASSIADYRSGRWGRRLEGIYRYVD